MTQAILPAFIVAGIVDAGFSREHALLRARIISLRLKAAARRADAGYNEQRKFLVSG